MGIRAIQPLIKNPQDAVQMMDIRHATELYIFRYLESLRGLPELKVTNKKGVGFYIRAAESFLKGMPAMEALPAKDGKEAKEAKEAKDPVDVLKISGLGEAINVAVAAAAAVTKDNLATITKIETEYPDMPVPEGSDRPARGCAQIVITVTRNK